MMLLAGMNDSAVSLNSTGSFSCPSLMIEEQCKLLILHKTHHKNIIMASLVICMIAIVVNTMEIGLLGKKKKRSKTELILLSLSTADLITAINLAIIRLNGLNLIPPEGFIYILVLTFSMILISIMHLLVMTVERTVAVTAPFWHKANITRKRVQITLSILWLNQLFMYLGKLLLFKKGNISFNRAMIMYLKFVSIVFFLTSIIIFISYAVIITKVKSSLKEGSSNEEYSSRKRKQRRLIIITCLISGTCFICYLPYTIVAWFSIVWVFRFQFCLCLSTLLNPLVYFFSSIYMQRINNRKTP